MENIARKNVAATGYRTRDLQITSQIRYQLSYPAGSTTVAFTFYHAYLVFCILLFDLETLCYGYTQLLSQRHKYYWYPQHSVLLDSKIDSM